MAKKTTTRRRRTVDEQIADLAAKINAIRERETRREAKKDPALRHATSAMRSLDKALAASKDAEVRHALLTVRSGLAPVLGTPSSPNGRVRRSAAEVDGLADSLLNYVINNPGQRGEVIAAEMAVDTNAMRPVMKKLIAAGKVRTEGQRRGMTYSAT